MSSQLIPREEWALFFDTFSRHHEGRLVSIDGVGRDSRVRSIARRLPLEGITFEPGHADGEPAGPAPEVLVMAGGGEDADAHVTHAVRAPAKVWLEEDSLGEDRCCRIDGDDGTAVLLKLHPPVVTSPQHPWSLSQGV